MKAFKMGGPTRRPPSFPFHLLLAAALFALPGTHARLNFWFTDPAAPLDPLDTLDATAGTRLPIAVWAQGDTNIIDPTRIDVVYFAMPEKDEYGYLAAGDRVKLLDANLDYCDGNTSCPRYQWGTSYPLLEFQVPAQIPVPASLVDKLNKEPRLVLTANYTSEYRNWPADDPGKKRTRQAVILVTLSGVEFVAETNEATVEGIPGTALVPNIPPSTTATRPLLTPNAGPTETTIAATTTSQIAPTSQSQIASSTSQSAVKETRVTSGTTWKLGSGVGTGLVVVAVVLMTLGLLF